LELLLANKEILGDFFKPCFIKKDVPVFKLFLGGEWVESKSGELLDVDTPIDNSLIARVQRATKEEALKAIEFAEEGSNKIREIPGIDRVHIFSKGAKLLNEHKEEVAKVIMLESGKPYSDALGEVKATIERMEIVLEEARKIFGEYLPGDWCEDTSGKIALVIREPVGVVAAISPFNYPLFIGATKIIPSLLAGNGVIIKPSSETPLSQIIFARILEEAGIPKGSLNVITGLSNEIGEILVSDFRVSLISLTGSTETGKKIVQKAGIKKLHLELGGKGVAIVLDDADIDLAAKKCVEGALKNAGQRCDAISNVLVMDSIADIFVQKVLKEVEGWKLGDPREEGVKMGPLINREAVKRVHDLVQDALSKGAKLLKGGKYKDCYFEPTVLDQVPLNSRIVWEEVFGPVINIIRVKNEDEALSIANRARYGLDSCVFSRDFYRIWKVAKRLKVGSVTVNDYPRHGVGYFPFGGAKESGIGREGIGYSIDETTDLKTIVFNLEPAGLGKLKHIH